MTFEIYNTTRMIKTSFTLLLILMVFLSFSCSKEEPKPISTSTNKIMPLGASRVEGNRPEYESFRYELWKDLKSNEWTFDFIGTQTDMASYPSWNSESFDNDHEGRGGWTSGQILEELEGWLMETGAPDIVLFSSPGGNDALQNLSYSEAIQNINGIIDVLQSSNPNVTILVEQMAPGHSNMMTPELTSFIEQLHQDIITICSQQSTSSSSIIAVDMYTGFNNSYLADDVHYNQAGADFIAQRYFSVLDTILE